MGCGNDAWGDVRVDLGRMDWLYSESSVNIIADAQVLPFRDAAFAQLKASHVIEHVNDWRQAVAEWCRVADTLRIYVPYDSSVPKLEWRLWLFSFLVMLIFEPNHFLRMPQRNREHLWNFKGRLRLLIAFLQWFNFLSTARAEPRPMLNHIAYMQKAKRFPLRLANSILTYPYQYRIEARRHV